MDWKEELIKKVGYQGAISNLEEKEIVADKIAKKVNDGDVIGFGSGTTSCLAIIEIAQKIEKENLNILAIPTSSQVEKLCELLKIKTVSLSEKKPDWNFDGADEIDKNNWMIKGMGAAMFREKMVILNSPKTYILVDKTKFVEELGKKQVVPVEINKEAILYVKEELLKLGAKEIILRKQINNDTPILTDNNNYILDVKFDKITQDLENKIKLITGVIESGLFINYNIEIIF